MKTSRQGIGQQNSPGLRELITQESDPPVMRNQLTQTPYDKEDHTHLEIIR